MVHIMSCVLFLTVFGVAIWSIAATVRSEMASIRRALGLTPPAPPLARTREARVRVIRQSTARPVRMLQARAA